MTLERGLQIVHNGVPVELLYLMGITRTKQTWMVKALFVEPVEYSRVFASTDTMTKLHSQTGPAARRASGL